MTSIRTIEPADTMPEPAGGNGAGEGAKIVTLPASREAAAWDRATDALLAALMREEQAALCAYEAARERLRTARRSASALRQLRGLVTIEQRAPALAPPNRPASGDKPWSGQHPCCVVCGTTSVKHAARGRCQTCNGYIRARGVERPRELWGEGA